MKTHCDICNENFKSEEALAMHSAAKHKNSDESVRSKGSSKKIWIFIAVFIALAFGIYFYAGSGRATGNATADSVQKITISFKDYNYYPRTITVKQGIPVEITLDSSVGGCFRTLVIKDLGVNQYSASPSQTIKFTPTQKGSFQFACGMHMATGTIVVE